mmetsp:Transcript_34173/g.41320  ORF Transcript_34173/g.41320 Transcript_34173/m.41320 type:complete len:310 (-) Transcript_34173:615-1544(-)|eukprot:CAMPEP_0197850882 /NCGR_PEP_ID=MMETSP1438-20131217/16656_1 /TAXON_ID=1461541 /ORGANISM="Pterosperma sp., Strain CCMP1384" /LENGTH=309 /DNA_ID=CAMNT_0043464275 /DNA_START=98 /DNA_END=1027 /DNA_ORIENTATION=-
MKAGTRGSSADGGGNPSSALHTTRDNTHGVSKLPTVRHSPLQQRMEERAHAAAVRRSAAATTMPLAFGSSSERMKSKVIGVKTHLDPQQEESPDPGAYNIYESGFSNTQATLSQSGFSAMPMSPGKNSTTLWSRSASPRMAEQYGSSYTANLGPETYNAHSSMDYTRYAGSVWLDHTHPSSTFGSKTKRFEVPGVEILEIPDAKYTMEWEAKHWTSKGAPMMKDARMRRANVHQVDKGFLTQPSVAPGHIYNTDCPLLPTIATNVATMPSVSSAIFRDKSERFPDPKWQYSRPLGPDTYSGAWFRAIKV